MLILVPLCLIAKHCSPIILQLVNKEAYQPMTEQGREEGWTSSHQGMGNKRDKVGIPNGIGVQETP